MQRRLGFETFMSEWIIEFLGGKIRSDGFYVGLIQEDGWLWMDLMEMDTFLGYRI